MYFGHSEAIEYYESLNNEYVTRSGTDLSEDEQKAFEKVLPFCICTTQTIPNESIIDS